MKSYNKLIINILFLFFSFIFSQLSNEEMMIKREVETLREQTKHYGKESHPIIYPDYADTLIFDKHSKFDSESPKGDALYNYGYDILKAFDERIIWNNNPPSGEYMLGTGDEVIIEIWGDTQLRAVHVIDQYGKINIDKIGQINLSGIALKDLQSKLIGKFQNVYSSLKGPDKTAYLDISIGKLKSINVSFLGQSISPGIHAIHPFSTIITGLMQTGGINLLGTLRDIQIIRNGKKIASLDLYDYLSNGDTKNDIRLLDGDILFVPLRYSTISINGVIMRPAIYELLPNETLDDILRYSGGLTAKSRPLIGVRRLETSTELSATHIINYNTHPNFILKNGDAIEVFGIAESDHSVYVFGQVKNPGSFVYDTEKETLLLDILRLAGALDDNNYLQTIYTDIGEIIRNHPETNYPEIIKFNIKKLISGDPNENKVLKNWDIILIRENPNYNPPKKVTLLGEVNVPGIYTLQKKWENLNDIINRSGGFTDEAFNEGIRLYRDSKQVVLNNFNIILVDGDSLVVPEHPGVVEVIGEVNRSGYIQYDKNKRLGDYIDNAGGFTEYSDRKNITIIHANGDVSVNKYFRNPKITEGSSIIINKKQQLEPFSLTEFTTNFASLITSIATLILIIAN